MKGRSRRTWLRYLLPVLALALMPASAPSAIATEPDFPVGFEGYHTYSEIDAVLSQAVADHGSGTRPIIRRLVIGQSFEGRDIWAVKISDRVYRDEAEPEVLSECGMHAREHLTVEMCLHMIALLTDNYGAATALGQRVTRIVNSTEIWIVPTLNPDGAAFDISGGVFHKWRKNRQPTPGTDKIGIDLNRNWGYRWGGAGSAAKPGSGQYRGQYPFEAVENVVLRDFILSRRIGGVQQIKTVFNWHSYGEFIMRPYGYTKEDIPADMTVDDYSAFMAMGSAMARLNGYGFRQGSDSYIYSGDFPAWAYGDQRMFVYTFEMYPPWGCNGCGGFYPPDELIERETTRNAEMALYFLEQARCPFTAAGLARTHCGPFSDDFETDRGWTTSGGGAGTGQWQRAIPVGTSGATGFSQLASVPSGQADLVTGADAGATATDNDVDGSTVALSRRFKLGSGRWRLSFSYSFAHDSTADSDDRLTVSVVTGTTITPVFTVAADGTDRAAAWQSRSVNLSAFRGKNIQLRFEAIDGGTDSHVEAAVDDVRVFRP